MKKKMDKRLAVLRQTVRTLGSAELREAAGGVSDQSTTVLTAANREVDAIK